MARGRMISKDASRDPDLNRLPIEAELVYVLSLAHLDRDGLISGEPQLLFSDACPLRAELLDKMPAIIQSWIDAQLIIRYEWKDGPLLYFPGFRKHNSNLEYTKEPTSKYPPPPHFTRCEFGLLPDDLDAALNLSEYLSPRNQYHQALLHHANLSQTSRSPLEVISQTSGLREEKHKQNINSSTDDDEENVLLDYAVQLATDALPEWTGTHKFLANLNTDQFCAALSWIWLHSEIENSVYDLQHERHYCDQVNPFADVDNIPGKIITQTRLTNYAPLHSNMSDLLRQDIISHQPQTVPIQSPQVS